jgi:WhiB family redox-sensing transcriptional regulator
VREACLDFALSTGQAYGIWGGLTEDERRSLRRRRQRAAARRPAADQPRDDRVAG